MQPIELLKSMQQMLNFDETDSQRLVEIGPVLLPHGSALAETFYAALDRMPETKAVLDESSDRRMRLHQTLIEWYTQIFSGQYDEAYANRRYIIGLVHVKVGIPPRFVVGLMENVYRFSARQLIGSHSQLNGPLGAYIDSLTKMLSIDLAFIEQSFAETSLRSMSLELGADERLFRRFMGRGVQDLLAEARSGRF